MAAADRPYQGFLGTWVLIPESCKYEQGEPPQDGRYVIVESDGRLTFTIDWTDAAGSKHHVSFGGVPNGQPVPFAGGELADALSISSPSDRHLDSVAYWRGEALMWAERQLDDTGNAMRVVQQVKLPDGSRPTNVSLYRRFLPS